MKAIITVIGKDRVGIIHDVSKILLEKNINIKWLLYNDDGS